MAAFLRLWASAVLIMCVLGAASASAETQETTLTARVQVEGEKTPVSNQMQNVVVWLSPVDPRTPMRPFPAGRLRLTQHHKSFEPHLLVVPVGAVVVHEGKIVGSGFNRSISDSDPTAHAEVIALREAGRTLGNYRLNECDLFATVEPCAMCAGAMVHARIRRLFYGADDPKAGAVHSIMHVLNHPGLNHKIEICGGVLAGRCAEILQEFFRSKR